MPVSSANPKVTIVSVPKPFVGNTARLQFNAIRSWLHFDSLDAVILYASDKTMFTCEHNCSLTDEELRRIHVRPINSVNQYGTPYLDEVFSDMRNVVQCGVIIFINADIVLNQVDVAPVLRRIKNNDLAVGSRWNVEYDDCINSRETVSIVSSLQAKANDVNRTNYPHGSDYFIWNAKCIPMIPKYLVGRPGWDDWVFAEAKTRGVRIVDCTRQITAVHQDHDYSHVPMQEGERWDGPEGDYNRGQALLLHSINLVDADYVWQDGKMRRNASWQAINRAIERMTPGLAVGPVKYSWQIKVWLLRRIRRSRWRDNGLALYFAHIISKSRVVCVQFPRAYR